jgi:hypothetical protein
MYRNSFLKQILLGLFVVLFASCDKDFNEIGTNIIGDDHFNFDRDTTFFIKASNQKLGPVASNNLDINALGIYNNPAFGKTTASFVTQIEMVSANPTFTTINNPPVIDSVILNIPYLSTFLLTDDAGNKTYELDSLFGGTTSKLKLGVYESGFYLRDLDPSQQFAAQQVFYTDKNAEIDSYKIGARLNNSTDVAENDQFFFDASEIKEQTLDNDGNIKITKSVPAMRMHLRTDFFTDKILNASGVQLINNNVFKNYIRGLYFKVENAGSEPGNMAMINFKKGKITIYYKQDNRTKEDDPLTTANEEVIERLSKTYVLNTTGNTVSLLDNANENADYLSFINNPDTTLGDERLYLKGGEGSIAVIDIFDPTDIIKYDAENDVIVSGSNGVSDELDNIKANKWLINEANLTFYVDESKMTNAINPERVFLYDLTNNKPLLDYSFDNSTNSSFPKRGKTTFGGILEKETTAQGGRTKYKVRITNHVRNLIVNDSTNVRLGLSVTENINNVLMSKLKTANAATSKAPTMSVLSPIGTVIYGTKSTSGFPIPVQDNKDSRLRLEIYYTKPNLN